jgi:hypothetical protein
VEALEAELGVVDTVVDIAVEGMAAEGTEAEALEPDSGVELQAVQGPVHIALLLEHKMVFCNAHNYTFLHLNWSFSSPGRKNVINNIKFPIKMLILIF